MAAADGITKLSVMLLHRNSKNAKSKMRNLGSESIHRESGFTLIEMIVVILMIGILSAIVAPSWLGFVNQQRLNKAYDSVFSALQQAQTSAKKSKLSYSASFRVDKDIPQYIVYQGTALPTSGWNNLGVDLKAKQVLLYTNLSNITTDSKSNLWNTKTTDGKIVLTTTGSGTITFDYMGALAPKASADADTPLKVMVAIPKAGTTQAGASRRCTIVDTLIGGMQTQKDANCS